MKIKLIAPCGMNCALCIGFVREKNRCAGCNGASKDIHKGCRNCRITNCPKLKASKSKYCFTCDIFPCARLKQLDKRYRTKYEMSMIENLEYIRDNGIRKFIQHEKRRWVKGDKVYCVHRKKYYKIT